MKLSGKTILVVDDEPYLREILCDELRLEGATVLEAEDGKAGLAVAESQKVDAVISDIRMPGGSGVELLEQIRAKHQDLPAVMLVSGFSDFSLDEAYDKGAEAVFSKPFDMEAIVKSLTETLGDPQTKWHRKIARSPSDFTVELRLEGQTDLLRGSAFNVGRGGMFVRLNETPPPVGSQIWFRVFLEIPGGGALEGMAICRWRREVDLPGQPKGMGVEFQGLTPSASRLLRHTTDSLRTRAYIPNK